MNNNHKTYTEGRNYAPFDWNKALDNPDITRKDWADMNCRASDWVTCAVGNQCAIIPRDSVGEPLDEELNWLGISFMMAIKNRNVEEAKEVLGDIERRSAELIAKYSN